MADIGGQGVWSVALWPSQEKCKTTVRFLTMDILTRALLLDSRRLRSHRRTPASSAGRAAAGPRRCGETCHTLGQRGGLIPFDLEQGEWPVPEARGPGVLFVCGAMTGLTSIRESPERARHINLEQTQRVIELRTCARGFRPVFLSTDKVYGLGEGPFREEQAGKPVTLYGRLKWELETWLSGSVEDALVVRLSKVYGTDKADRSIVQEMLELPRVGPGPCPAVPTCCSTRHTSRMW